MVGFINSAQQLFGGVFGQADRFPMLFAFIAGGMGVASILNSKIVMRVGSRRVSHTALLLFIILCATHLLAIETLGGAVIGILIGQSFDGTVFPS